LDEILLLQSDTRALATLMRALDPPHSVRAVKGFLSLSALLRNRKPRACVLDVFDSPSKLPMESLRRLRRRHPTVALVIASNFRGREMALYHLGQMSVDGVIRMEEDPSPRDLLAVVDRAITASLATRVVMEVAADLPHPAQEAIRWAIEQAEATPHVSELAAALALSPKVLHREMRSLGLGSPRGLLLWGRLIRASQLLERPSETVESVAFHLGYATGGALGKALKRHVGCSPTELLEKGGLAWTLQVFRQRGLHDTE
jgi:AraC-like DNA-binding protein